MLKELLTLKTVSSEGVVSDFLVDGEACVLHAYEYTAARMGSHKITATVQCRECLDSRWTGREFVEYAGQKYVLATKPSSSKASDDFRYSHSLEFTLTLDLVLSGTLFVDAVSGTTGDKPRSNTTSFNFCGTVREFAERLKSVMTLSKIDCDVRVDDEIPEGEAETISFEDSTVLEAVQEAFTTYGVPYWYDLSGAKPCIVFGFVHNIISEPLKYGADAPLSKIERNTEADSIINRCSGYGSDENLPYYYPNLSPEGELEVATNRDDLKIAITDPVKAAKLIGKTLDYAATPPISGVKGYFSVYGQKATEVYESYENTVLPGQSFAAAPVNVEERDVFVYLPYGAYGKATAIFYAQFYALAPCTVKIDYSLLNPADVGYSWALYKGENESLVATGGRRLSKNTAKIESPGLYTFREINNYQGVMTKQGYRGTFRSLVATEGEALYWKEGETMTELGNYGLTITSGTPQKGDTIEVHTKVDAQGVRKYPFATQLMPYIWRESLARERFYDAVNSFEDFYARYSAYYGSETAARTAYERIYATDGKYLNFPNPVSDQSAPVEAITEFEDIKPTIDGITNAAGQFIGTIGAVAFDTNDDDSTTGEDSEDYAHPNFFIKLRQFDGDDGFNLFAHTLEGGEMTLNMTSGKCAGCSFPIMVAKDGLTNLVEVDDDGNLVRDDDGNVVYGGTGQDRQNDTRTNEVWIAVQKDSDTFGELMPCLGKYEPAEGDSFVITGISLPQSYITAAEKRLEKAIIDYLVNHNSEAITFNVTFSTVYTAQNSSVMDLLDENATVVVEYDGKQYSLYVSQYTVRAESDSAVPTVTITISEDVDGETDAIRSAIAQAKEDTQNAIAALDATKIGLPYFLRKDIDDACKGTPTFLNGAKFGDYEQNTPGAGAAVSIDSYGNSTIEADFLKVRKKADFSEVEVHKTTSVGGRLVVSLASAKITTVEETDEAYKCYLATTDGNGGAITNDFEAGDLAYCQTFNDFRRIYYWRRVTAVGTDYVELSKTDCDSNSGTPSAGDTIVQLGNATDANRQAAQMLLCTGDNAPAFYIYDNISTYSLADCLQSGFETKDNKARFFVYGQGYIGDRDRKQYIESEDGNLNVTGIINALGGVMSGLLAVKDSDGNIRAGFSGGEQGKDATHNRMVLFAGADNTKETQDEQIANSKTKIYEDGHISTTSANIEGRVVATEGKFGNFEIDDIQIGSKAISGGYSLWMSCAAFDLNNPDGVSGWKSRFNASTYPSATHADTFSQVFSNVEGSKSSGSIKRDGTCIYANAKGADINYAFLSESGMFAGLRPKAIHITGQKQIGAEKYALAGSDTLRVYDHTVLIWAAFNITIYLPETPEEGQYYEIISTQGYGVTISGNGHNINHWISQNGGSSYSESIIVAAVAKIDCYWDATNSEWLIFSTIFKN